MQSILGKSLLVLFGFLLMAMFCMADIPIFSSAGLALVSEAEALTPRERRVNRRISRRVNRRHALGSIFYALPVGYTMYHYNGVNYYYADETYFVEEQQGGDTVYIVVEDPNVE